MAAEPNTPIRVDEHQSVIRVACVGDSITAGVGAARGKSYPAQLAKVLGDKWEVRNFGVSGSTLLKRGDLPYQKQQAFKAALEYNPNVVVIGRFGCDAVGKPTNLLRRSVIDPQDT